jgi:replicative DNA helicase
MSELTDFNDLASERGLEAVADVIKAAVQTDPRPPEPVFPDLPDNQDDTAVGDEWPEPVLPGQAKAPDIRAALLPGWCGDMAHAVAQATQTPPAMSVMFMLSVLATVLQRRFEVEPTEGYVEPLALWTNCAAPSASRKSAVMSALLAPLLRWEKLEGDRMRREIARANARRSVALKRIEKLRQDAAKAGSDQEREDITKEIEREELDMPDELRAPRLFVGDVTLERLQALLVEHGGRMSILSDEPGIFLILAGLYNGGSANFDVALQGHAGSPLRVDRAGRSAYVDRPALSFGLLLQPGILADVASSRRFRDSGLLARFMFALPESLVGKRDVRQRTPVPEAVKAEYERRLFELLDGYQDHSVEPQRLTFSDSARELWLDFAQAIEDGLGEGRAFEAINDWCGKLPGAVTRIAALMEIAECGLHSDVVHECTMRRAIELAWLLVEHARAAFALLGTDEADNDAAFVLRWIRGEAVEEFRQRDAQKAMEGRFRSVERLKKALDRLEAGDVLRGYKRKNQRGPATMVYTVNPRILS